MIPLFSAQAANAGLNLESGIFRVLRSNRYVLGSEVTAFESEFSSYIGAIECVTLANGTDALEMALRAVGVSAGDRVVCVANAGFYGSTAIHAIGAKPLYVDVEATTLNMATAALATALELKPKAVIVTHLYGQMADIEEIVTLAHRAGVKVIEDCAQAHGATRHGRRAGSIGDVGCFSFYPTKNLGALGDGGAVVCNEVAVAEAVRTLRQYGWSDKYHVSTPLGRNSRLDEIQAAVLRAKLPHLDAANRQRREIAAKYNSAFHGLPLLLPPSVQEDYVGHLYVVRVEAREAFREHMRSQGIATDVHYPIPDHLQSAYPKAQVTGILEHSVHACRTVVSLPCFPGLTDAESSRVIDGVRSFFVR